MPKILVILMLCIAVPAAAEIDQPVQDIHVNVSYEGKEIVLDTTFTINSNVDEVWAVLTDFDHATQFISNLKESKILETKENVLKVEQKGLAKYGLLSFKFESTREIRLTPKSDIQTHMLSGTMKKFDASMHLKVDGDVTEVVYRCVSVPGFWIPPLIGKRFIQRETEEQFSEIRQEVMRRKNIQKSN